MTIDRRAVLSGLLAAPVVLHLPVQAAAPAAPVEPLALPQHPLFGVHEAQMGEDGERKVQMLASRRLTPDEGGPGLGSRVGDLGLDLRSFGGFEQAENAITNRIVRDALIREGIPSATDVVSSNVMKIVRVSNMIATRCRRGAGNHALMHEADLVHLEERFYGLAPDDAGQLGRWKRAAFINANMSVWTTRDDSICIPRGFVLVGWKGAHEFDSGAHIARMSSDRYGIGMVPAQVREDTLEPLIDPLEIARYYSGKTKAWPQFSETSKIVPASLTSYFGLVELTTPENRPLGFVWSDGTPVAKIG